MALARYMLDTSAESDIRFPQVADRIENLLNRGLVATCGMLNMEAAWSAQGSSDLDQLTDYRRIAFEYLDTEERDWERAQELQIELCRAGLHRSAKHPDLIIATVAERHGLIVLHYDFDYEHIASVSNLQQEWIAPRGSLSTARMSQSDEGAT